MKKKLLAILLTVCMVLSMAPAALAAEADLTISTADQLKEFASAVNGGNDYAGQTVVLANSITLSGEWTPIGNGTRSGSGYSGYAFKGTFDGGNNTISGLTITSTSGADAALGLFGVVDGGTVKNLNLTDVKINVSNSELAGGAIGMLTGGGAADTIAVSGSISAGRGDGGIVGRMTVSGTISNCVNNATMNATGGANLGGIVGAAYYTAEGKVMNISNCTNNGTVTGSAGGVGGIVGLSSANVTKCSNTAAVTGANASVGGIVGEQQNYGSIVGCVNSAAVTNTANYGTGGIVGWVRYNGTAENYPLKGIVEVKNNTNSGTVSGGNDAGGIVGVVYNAAEVSGNENNAASLTASNFAAGIVANVQFTETPTQGSSSDNKNIPQQSVNLQNNISTTALDDISAANKGLYAYDNSTNTQDGEISENSAEWVAKVGDTKYATLAGALADGAGKTVTLLTDITVTEQILIEDNDVLSDITLDGNGKTIYDALSGSSTICFGSEGHWATGVKIKDLTVTAAESNTTPYCAIRLYGGTSSVLTNVKVEGAYTYGINFYGTHGGTLTDCDVVSAFTNAQSKFPLTLVNSTIGTLHANAVTEASGKGKITIGESSSIGTLVAWGGNTEMIASGLDKVTTITDYDSNPMAAEVNGAQYSTLAAAVAAAQNGDTVTLLKDVNLTAKITVEKDVTITADSAVTITAEVDDLFTVTDGSLTMGENLTINNSSTILYVTGGSATVAGAKLNNSSNQYPTVMATNSGTTLTISGGEINATAKADGNQYDMAVVVENNATATVTDGTIYAEGNNALMVGAGSTVTVSGGTVKTGAGNPYAAAAVNAAESDATLTISGTAKVEGTTALRAKGTSGKVTVTGGTITGALGEVDSGELTVSGGTFSVDASEYCIAGYKTVETSAGSGVYVLTMKEDNTGTVVAKIGEQKFDSLQAAVTAAQNNDTIELVEDVTLNEGITISDKNLTIDNGKITFDASGYDLFTVQSGSLTLGGNLTIESNSTILYVTGGEAVVAGAKLSNTSGQYPTVMATGSGTILTVAGGEINATAAADANDNDFAVVVEDGATANVLGGTISAVGNNALMVGKDSKVEVSGGTVKTEAGNPYAAAAVNAAEGSGSTLTISGTANVVGGETALRAKGGKAEVAVTGGTITGALGEAESGTLTVSGGTFSDKTVEDYLAEGYVLESYTDGTGKTVYGVEPVYTVTITIPAGAAIVVKDSDGNEVTAEEDGTYKVVNGTYTYTVSKSGYNTKADTFTVNDADMSFSVSLSVYVPYVPSTPSYSVTVSDAANGTVTVRPSAATSGSSVTITVTPDAGYTLETLTVLNQNGKEIELTYNGDGKYTFKMPASKVTVYATFMEDNTMLNYFTDVFASDYYYDAVLWAVENGITNGTSATTFSPDAVCTRAQVVTFLWRAAGSPEPVSTVMPFTDVVADAYYYDAVLWAVENGITNGTSATTFSPDADCTRGQIVTFLWRSQGSENASGYNPFVDVANDAYYTEAVLWAVENGITNGTGANTFSPDADCTRGQIVTFLYRCLAE